ncbi:DivIVA domain-containing protein [Kribbella sindirgiensis]|nr:DivIVA domain-containing protein [Kribbella sindirgiensis]
MWFFGLIVVLLIGAVAVVASGRWGAMSTAYDDRPDMTVPARQALTSTDIESARFAVGVRGYRMDEVDTLLERVAKEVAERDRRIADLERAVAPIVEAPDGHGFSSRPYDPAEFEDTGTQQPILVGGAFPDPTTQPTPAAQPTDPEESAGSEAAEAADTASDAATGTSASSAGADEADDEPETTELPRAVQAAADEYERLQAEARAVLEAQSQPVTPRRTPAPHQQPPAQQNHQPDPAPAEPPVEPPTAHWTSLPPEQAPDEPAAAQQPPADQPAPEQQVQTQQPPADQPGQEKKQAQGEQGDEEGWRFWPPADQQGEGAYQRPS